MEPYYRSAHVWHALSRNSSFTCTHTRLPTNGMNHTFRKSIIISCLHFYLFTYLLTYSLQFGPSQQFLIRNARRHHSPVIVQWVLKRIVVRNPIHLCPNTAVGSRLVASLTDGQAGSRRLAPTSDNNSPTPLPSHHIHDYKPKCSQQTDRFIYLPRVRRWP